LSQQGGGGCVSLIQTMLHSTLTALGAFTLQRRVQMHVHMPFFTPLPPGTVGPPPVYTLPEVIGSVLCPRASDAADNVKEPKRAGARNLEGSRRPPTEISNPPRGGGGGHSRKKPKPIGTRQEHTRNTHPPSHGHHRFWCLFSSRDWLRPTFFNAGRDYRA